jgi:hypothetical protein
MDSVPLPLIDPKKRKRISALVKQAFELRAKAIRLLDEAKGEIYKESNAPDRIDESNEQDERGDGEA